MEDITYNSKKTILKTLKAEDLPIYTSWQDRWFYRVRLVDGKIICDTIKIDYKEYCCSSLDLCLDVAHKRVAEDDWNNAVHKLMKYIR